MKIDVCSDLHVDSWKESIIQGIPGHKQWMGEPFQSTFVYLDWEQYRNPESTVLVIAGDVANNFMITSHVVEAAAAEYEHVVVVEGNHDHYMNDMTIDSGAEFFKNLISRFSNAYHLDGETSLLLDGVLFIGSTAWYDFKAYETRGIYDSTAKRMWKNYSNDSRFPDFDGKSVESIAMVQALKLSDQVRAANNNDEVRQIVVTTHMSPRADLMEWKDGDNIWNGLTPSYVNTALQNVIDANTEGKITHWIYGHTHARQMVDREGIIYINNARGYPTENPPFTLTQIEVGTK